MGIDEKRPGGCNQLFEAEGFLVPGVGSDDVGEHVIFWGVHSSADECDQVVLHFAELMSRTDHVLTRVRETELRQICAPPALDRAHFEIVNLQLLDAEGDRHRQCEIV